MDDGFINLHRKIWNNELWLEESPFDRRAAWIDLLLMANFRTNTIVYMGKTIKVKRGQVYTSIRILSGRWGWSKDKTLRFIRLLEELDMVKRDKTIKCATLLTIVKYEDFQYGCDTRKDTHKDTDKDTHKDTDSPLHKKDKKDNKKDKKEEAASQSSEDDDCYTEEEWEQMCAKWRAEHGTI